MLSPADVAVLSGNTSRNNDGLFGDNGAWWIIVLLLFGWGRNGFGGGFGGNGGVGENYILATDFATIERKLDGVNNGICDSTFALNNTINNGFFGVQNSLTQGFAGLNTALLQGNYNLSAQLADCCCGLKSQLADCCCTTQRGLDAINYSNAINTNSIQQTLCNNTRDIIENQNANYRALHDEIVANRIEDKNAQIQAQQNEINALRLSASQERKNAYLLSELKPCPSPAYFVPNPNCCYNPQVTFNACGGCGNY